MKWRLAFCCKQLNYSRRKAPPGGGALISFFLDCLKEKVRVIERLLAAAAGAAAFHAAVAGSVADHDGSAGGAAGGVAHVVHALHGVGGVVDAAVFDREGIRG